MKIWLICTLLQLVTMLTEAQKSVVSGTIKGLTNDTLTIFYLDANLKETPIIEKVICRDNKVNLEVQLGSSFIYYVSITTKEWDKKFSVNTYPYQLEMYDINFFIHSGDTINFIAEPGTDAFYVQAYGNTINEQRNELHKKLYPMYNELNAACLKFAQAKIASDSLHINEGIQSLEGVSKEIHKVTAAFILKHPDWDISAEILMTLPMDSCAKYFEKLTPKVQSSFFGQSAREQLLAQKIGEPATPFSLPDPQGKQVALSDYNGKYVVIDFWGTWCGWCIKDLPRMKQYYNRYKDKVEFISIACNDSQERWKEAVKRYEMNWVNVLNPDDKLTIAYGIGGYPTKLIIDPKGNVVGKYMGEGRDFYTRLDELFKK